MRRFLLNLASLLLILLAALLLLLGLYRSRVAPVLCRLAVSQTEVMASAKIGEAIAEELSTGRLPYGKIIQFEKDASGKITALRTNMQQVNLLKAGILQRINGQILNLDAWELGVPLGSLLLPELFSGKGPVIPVKVLSIHSSNADFLSHFTQAGINQTLHQLQMRVQAEGSILVMGRIQNFSASNIVVVAETVIVGEVPHSFS